MRLAAISALGDAQRRAEVDRAVRRLTHLIASDVVDGVMDGSIRPLDPSIAAQISAVGVNAIAGIQRWAPEANADNAGELDKRPVFMGILCPPSGT